MKICEFVLVFVTGIASTSCGAATPEPARPAVEGGATPIASNAPRPSVRSSPACNDAVRRGVLGWPAVPDAAHYEVDALGALEWDASFTEWPEGRWSAAKRTPAVTEEASLELPAAIVILYVRVRSVRLDGQQGAWGYGALRCDGAKTGSGAGSPPGLSPPGAP